MKNWMFTHYLFDTSVNGNSVAVYESADGKHKKVCVERDGKQTTRARIYSSDEIEEHGTITSAVASDFNISEDDIYYNKARAVLTVVEAMEK